MLSTGIMLNSVQYGVIFINFSQVVLILSVELCTILLDTFTYIRKETTFITNLFKNTDIKIAFHTNNTILSQLTHKNQKADKYTSSGVYKLTCPGCQKAYVGLTGRSFLACYNENKHAFRNNSHTSTFAQHLNEQAHSFGTIHNMMVILQYQKGAHIFTVNVFTFTQSTQPTTI